MSRLLTALALAAVLAIAGCGDDGGGEAGGGGATGGEEASARAAVEQMYAALQDMDAEAACAQLSEAGRRQIAAGGLGGKTSSCPKSFERFFSAARKAGGFDQIENAEIGKVTVRGDKATAKVSFGEQGGAGDVPLVKEKGQWRLDAVGSAAP
jgi:hypothetical protein